FCSSLSLTDILTPSLHDALPISPSDKPLHDRRGLAIADRGWPLRPERGSEIFEFPSDRSSDRCRATAISEKQLETFLPRSAQKRSEEHTSELQSREKLVCRLLLE